MDILYWVGGFVAAYLLFVVIMGVFKGWSSVVKIWYWTKKLFWILFVVAGLIFIARALRNKDKWKQQIDQKIAEIKGNQEKTEADQKELERLEKEKKKVEEEIIDISKKYQEKINKIKEKPPTKPPIPDAGKASDELDNAWR